MTNISQFSFKKESNLKELYYQYNFKEKLNLVIFV